MTHATDWFDLESPRWLGCLVLVCIGIGVLTGIDPLYGLLAAGGLAFAGVVIKDLTAGFVLFTGLSFLDLLNASGSFSGTKILGLVLFMSWLARVTAHHGAHKRSFAAENPGLAVALLAMLGWSALSFAWATSPTVATGGTLRYALDMILIPVAFAAIRERRELVWVIEAFVAGAVFSSIYGFLAPASIGRATGSLGDPNAEATVLVSAIPLLICLVGVTGRSAGMKIAAPIGVLIMFAGLVATLSREGLLALGAVMVAAVIFGGRWRGRAAVLLVLGVSATCGYFFVLAPLTARQRVTSSDTSGRSSIWTVAWRVVEAHPVLGVGTDNFPLVEGRYINRPGSIAAENIIVVPKVVHDVYLGALAELGIPGLLTLLAVIGLAVAAAVRATWIFERLGDRDMELTSRAVVLALIPVFVGDFFVSGQYEKFAWLLLSLCPVLLALARRAAAEATAPPFGH